MLNSFRFDQKSQEKLRKKLRENLLMKSRKQIRSVPEKTGKIPERNYWRNSKRKSRRNHLAKNSQRKAGALPGIFFIRASPGVSPSFSRFFSSASSVVSSDFFPVIPPGMLFGISLGVLYLRFLPRMLEFPELLLECSRNFFENVFLWFSQDFLLKEIY